MRPPRIATLTAAFASLAAGLLTPTRPATAQAPVSIPGRCHMGQCLERHYLGKVPIATADTARLYAVSFTMQLVPMGETASEPPTETTHYVYCSTATPTYIAQLPSNPDEYYASVLNIGGDNGSGASMDAHWMYWAVCHDEIAWDLSSKSLRSQAIALGYPLNLEETSQTIASPFDVLD